MSTRTYDWFAAKHACPDPRIGPEYPCKSLILVEADLCPYGVKCYRKCHSVPEFPKDRELNKSSHQKKHWHIKPYTKWIEGRR